ncbi:unnamed protein product [Heligmosomoides polygyrus]|uniref:HORMA domain-containing protein n=1 Tax=Heligmosomoides polygyrus TaxID=6339 RepID=A0A183GJD9_HELPZ|nr:unnamed protein product [Heligmosomoides polygyrus]
MLLKLELFVNDQWKEGNYTIHNLYQIDSLKSVRQQASMSSPTYRKVSLIAKLKESGKVDEMELYMLVPVVEDDKVVKMRRIVVDSKLSLVAAMKANTVVDCPRFIARSKDGSEDAPRNDEFVPVEPPMSVIGYSPSLETSSSPGKKDDVPHRLEPTTAPAFTLSPNQVAASDRDILRGLSLEDQQLLFSQMPWERVVALAVRLKAIRDSDSEDLLIQCNLRLGELGIPTLPDGWSTSDKVPTLPGRCSSNFTPFMSFDMAEAPLVAKTITDVKKIFEEIATLKNTLGIPVGDVRSCLRFGALYAKPSTSEERLLPEAWARGIHYAFSIPSTEREDDNQSYHDFVLRTVVWSVEVTFSAELGGITMVR